MLLIWIGAVIISIGISISLVGLEKEFDKKMENHSDYSFSIGTLTFPNGCSDKPEEPCVITYLRAVKVK